jgi:hypothetical protein
VPAYKPDQRNQSSAGELKQLTRKQASPEDGVYSGALKRIKMVDGCYVEVQHLPTKPAKPLDSKRNHVGHLRKTL